MLVVVVGWWSGGYSGVGDYLLVSVGIYIYHFFCVTVIVVAVCSIATVRWWLSWFCLSNIEISFKSLMMLYVLIVRRFRDFRSQSLIFVSLICWGADFLVFVLLMRERVEEWWWCATVGNVVGFHSRLVGPRNISLHLIHKLFNVFPVWIALVSFGSVQCVIFKSFRCFIVCGWCWFTNERWYGLWSVVWWKVQYFGRIGSFPGCWLFVWFYDIYY